MAIYNVKGSYPISDNMIIKTGDVLDGTIKVISEFPYKSYEFSGYKKVGEDKTPLTFTYSTNSNLKLEVDPNNGVINNKFLGIDKPMAYGVYGVVLLVILAVIYFKFIR